MNEEFRLKVENKNILSFILKHQDFFQKRYNNRFFFIAAQRFFVITACVILCVVIPAFSQNKNVGIGTIIPDSSAILELRDSTKGLLIPRINLQNINLSAPVVNPAISLLVFNTNPSLIGGSGIGFYYWNGAMWIQALGPQGPTGPQGPQGLQGSTGSTGSQGPAGADGATGPQGPQGLQGTAGADGSTGPQGIQGLQGPTGSDGTTGPQGPQGLQGATGPTGADGSTGPQGLQGPSGADGATGPSGADGLIGPTGAAGINGADGATGATGPTGVQGPTGTGVGIPGPTGETGPTGPTGTAGAAGATGPTGADGTNGTNGATGPTGVAGTNGTNGATGPTGTAGTNGTNGANGATGPTGSAGTAGATGATGPTGTAGTNGTNGANGATGPTGTAGTNGTNGATGPTGSAGTAGATGPTGPGSVSGTATRVAFFTGAVGSASTTLSSTSASATDLFWDNTNSRLGIRTSTPSMALDVFSGSTTAGDAVIRGSSTGTGAVLFGVRGIAASATTDAAGVYGSTTGNGQVYGVLGITNATTGNASGVRGYAGGASGAINGVWGENASGTSGSAGVYGFSSSTANGTSWSSPVSGIYGKAANSTSQFQAGVYGYQSGTGNNSGGVVGAYSSGTWGGLGYSDGSGSRWGVFSPANAKIEGYLLVGNPATPTSSGGQYATLYASSFDAGSSGWSQNVDCDGAGDGASHTWTFDFTTNNGVMTYDNLGHRNRANLYSPQIWIPAGTTGIGEEGHFACTLEDNFDGIFLEYSVNGGAWTKVTVFSFGGYPDNASGSNTACSGNSSQSCWNGTMNGPFRCNVGTAGSWIQFRLVGMEDGSNGTGQFDLYGFSVYGVLPATVGGPFAAGNIYAENNVYAGSNALVGDVAEYFLVDAQTEPGDLIAMTKGRNNDFTISAFAYNPYLIGVHSTNPTVTLNKPDGVPVSLTGRVLIKVSAENGPVNIGDYLTSSSKPGYAMKADKPCFVVGRALETFSGGDKKTILCLIETGWYNPFYSGSPISEGSFFVPENKDEITVYDNAITEKSRVFLTFRGKLGAEHWLAEISKGYFTVRFDKEILSEVQFDYLVTNSQALPSAEEKSVKSRDNEKENISAEKQREGSSIREYSLQIPPVPADQESVWIFTSESGLVKTMDITEKKKNSEESISREQLRLKKETEEKSKPGHK